MRLIAITTPAVAQTLTGTDGLARGETLTVVSANELAAILAPEASKLGLLFATRRKALTKLVDDQRVLEAMLACGGPVLPARPGQRIASCEDARALLSAHAETLTLALTEFGGALQFQITMEWTGSPAARDMAAAAPHLPASAAAIETLVAAARQNLKDLIEPKLKRASRDMLDLPLDSTAMFANLVVLVPASGVAGLEAALEAIDEALPAPSRIRMIGPLPPVSFAAVTITPMDSEALALASQALDIDLETVLGDEPARLRRQYLDVVSRHHPDLATEANRAFSDDGARVGAAAQAYRLLSRYAKAARIMGPRNALLVDIVRQDQAGRRAA